MPDAIAIDFGTSRTKAAYWDERTEKPQLIHLGYRQEPFVPSLFYLPPGEGEVLWGEQAEKEIEDDPAGMVDVLKRHLQDRYVYANRRKFTPQALLTGLLNGLRQRAGAEVSAFGGCPPVKVLLTVPALYGYAFQKLVEGAARDAGFEEVELVPEPVAAARAWLAETGDDGREVIVLDCGGGTLDWAYMSYEDGGFCIIPECPAGCDTHVGGHDVDLELLNELRHQVEDAEEIRRRQPHYLSELRTLKERYCRGQSIRPLKVDGREVTLDAPTIQAVLDGRFVQQAVESLRSYLAKIQQARPGARPTVLLVGGSARIKGLKEAIEKQTGRQAMWWEHSEFATVLGAAISEVSQAMSAEIDWKQADIEIVRSQAERGDATAQVELADRYYEGRDVTQDYTQAVHWLKKGAAQNYAEAQANLGILYHEGKGVIQNYTKAASWLLKSAEQSNVQAQYLLGNLYYTGTGVKQDYVEAARWFRKAAIEQGQMESQFFLGVLYLAGEGVKQNYKEAVRWLRLAAEQGSSDAQYRLGSIYLNGVGVEKDPDEALRWFRSAAKQDNTSAKIALGHMYLIGNDVAKNTKEALRWFREAAEQGDAEAQALLGYIYRNGFNVDVDYAEAFEWALKAVKQDNATAQCLLGTMLRHGEGVTKNLTDAIFWFRQAAEQGDADAQQTLGYLYASGEGGVPKNYEEALLWTKRAAEQGQATAQYNLGFWYTFGVGVPKDEKQASVWFQKAGEQDDQAAPLLATLQQRLATAQWAESDAVSQQLIRIKSGFQRIDSRAAGSAIPAQILYMLDHWWRAFAGVRLASRDWVRLAGPFTDYNGIFSVTTFLEIRLKELDLKE